MWRGERVTPILGIALLPASWIYRIAVALRTAFWRFFAGRAAVPVISIGNLTVGGNSKTPFTIFIANLLAHRGWRVGIVSRGYGANPGRAKALLVALDGNPQAGIDATGDEPAMMARSFAGPIAVARRRIDAINLLTSTNPLDAVILDDGFQHLRLARAVDLVLINRERGFGNARMLPAGPMREPLSAIGRADAAIVVSADPSIPSALTPRQMKVLERVPIFNAIAHPRCLVAPDGERWRESPAPLAGRRVIALSGLADPSGFYAMIRTLEADLVGVLEYPDHHAYTASDWQAIVGATREGDLIVTTEKDLVKLDKFPFARDSICAIRLAIAMEPPQEAALLELIESKLRANSQS
jgi:tetraacyldisaccharide 4'-kinase